MIIGCKEHCEVICPDFPDKCFACGWYIDRRKEKENDTNTVDSESGCKRLHMDHVNDAHVGR